MNERDRLLAHMEDLADRAAKTGWSASRFLTPSEAQSVTEFFRRRRDVALTFDGGFNDAERTRAIFVNPAWGESVRTELIAALKITYRPQDMLTHRDILGALMALGIERDTVGDILTGEGGAFLSCLPELSRYIVENLTKAGRAGVTINEIGLDELPAKQEELTVKTDTVASLRLDAVLCAAFGLSRTKAAEIIASGRVGLDHQECLQPAKELREGSLLSVRGLGRAKLLEVGGTSKKGRIFVQIGVLS